MTKSKKWMGSNLGGGNSALLRFDTPADINLFALGMGLIVLLDTCNKADVLGMSDVGGLW